mgnify:FL=1
MADTVFVLASKSPRRKELLGNIGINVQIIPSSVDESPYKKLPPEQMVKELAMLKACDVARSLRGNTVVIGADTCVCLGGKVFGKPQNMAEAEEMLRELSGKTHEVFTGFCVYNCKDGTAVSRAEVTHVTFRVLTDSEIKAYVKTREPMDKAGAYGIQKRGALFIEKIEGDFFNVVGLPLCSLASALKSEFSIDIIG